MKETRPAIAWQEAYARLERARRALETGWERSPEETQRILGARARALAKPREEAPTASEVLDLLIFSLAGERYGIETAHVLEVVPLRELTPVPCTPDFYLGVMNHRGRILPILDLRRLFGVAGHGVAERGHVIAVETSGMTLGLFSQSVVGVIRVGAREAGPPPVALTGDGQAFIRGVTGDLVAVLDPERLARDPRIVLHEEIG